MMGVTMFRWLLAGLSGLYLLFPTGGIVEFAPDVIPLIGHLDEIAATYVMTTALGFTPGRDHEFKAHEIVLITFLGLLAIVYMIFPTLGTVEFIPDWIPVAGNLDEIVASIITFTMTNAYRNPEGKKKKNSELTAQTAAEDDLLVQAMYAQYDEQEEYNQR